MPKKFTEKTVSYFLFSVPTTRGATPGGLGKLISDMLGEGIALSALSTCVTGRRTKVFCVPKDTDLFRAFVRQRKIRVRQKSALIYSGDNWLVLGTLNKWAISGEVIPSLIYLDRGKALVYRAG
jgi:hypothetical protein